MAEPAGLPLRAAFLLAVLPLGAARAQPANTGTSAGPGTIVCTSAKTCVLGLGTIAPLQYHVDPSDLPSADQDRLAKQCTPKAKTECIATVTGTQMGDTLTVKAVKITWYN